MEKNNIEEHCINTIRFLATDAVQKANSGHPGMPMGAAPMAHVLWTRFLNHNPQNPDWSNRDRFILSAGHGCMLQYSLLHLTGYEVSMEEIKNFRQLHSITPGHPEAGLTPGVEVTTGPLGQGFANGVGMGIAQKHLAARYNKPGYPLFDYNIYAICSDGDLMEGISSESASLAGHLKLGNLIYLYDDNHISIGGNTEITFTEDTVKRFEAFGWHVQEVSDGNDLKAIENAINKAKEETGKPSIIKVRTEIGFGSPNKVNTSGAHGAPLGEEEVKLSKQNLGWDPDNQFHVPEEVAGYYQKAVSAGKEKEAAWQKLFEAYKKEFPELAREYTDMVAGRLPAGWDQTLPEFKPEEGKLATRKASSKAINALAAHVPTLMGGSADLEPSTNTLMNDYEAFGEGKYEGRNIHFGVREHAMGAIVNGITKTDGMRAFGATFLIFSDYMRPPVRLAAIMEINPVFVYTHDSIGLGEDGTTHQPVEQLASLRLVPNLTVIRPADANETSEAWRVAVEHQGGPVALILTRQGLPIYDRSKFEKARELEKGAYILSEPSGEPEIVLIGSGSEVQLAVEAREVLQKENINARVVSMPSWELFEKQDQGYKEKVLPSGLKKRLAIEAGSTMGWHKYVTDEGDVIGMDTFGESAPGGDLMKFFGFTVDNVVDRAKKLLKQEVTS